MKTLLTYLGAFLVLAFVSSCSKDETIPNRIIIDGESFKLSKGYIGGYGIDVDDNGDQGSLYEILLASSGVTFTGDDLEGTGQILDLIIFSGSTIELRPGTYQYSDGFIRSTLYDAFAADANFDTSVGTPYFVIDGSVTISRSGNTWTIKFTLEMEDDDGNEVDVTGSFSGQLTEIELN